MLGSRKNQKKIVLDFDEDNKDEDGELDLVQKLDNLDCIYISLKLIQMLDCDCQQI